MSDEAAMQLILEPGFSREQPDAGRRPRRRMDVVATEIKSAWGSGCRWHDDGERHALHDPLPFTLAISQALIVRTGDEL